MRNFGNIVNVKVVNSNFSIDVDGKPINFNISPGTKVSNIYEKLAGFEDARVESIDGVKISQSTDFSELQGSTFYIKFNNLAFKVVSNDLSTTIDMHKFLFESEKGGLSQYLFMHKFLSKLSKSTIPNSRYTKEQLATILDESCPKNKESSLMPASDIHQNLVKVFEELEKLRPTYEILNKKSENYAKNVLWGGFSVTLLQFLYITSGSYYFACWDVMEAQAYLISLGNTLFGLSAYVSYKLDPNHESFYTRLYNRALKSGSKANEFDLDNFNNLRAQLKSLQSLITLEKLH